MNRGGPPRDRTQARAGGVVGSCRRGSAGGRSYPSVKWSPAEVEEGSVTVRLVLGLLMTVAAFAVAGRRVWWLSRLTRAGQPAPGRLDGAPARLKVEVAEVFGQRKLLKWSVPGVAHFLTFWGFVILGLTIIEAWGG